MFHCNSRFHRYTQVIRRVWDWRFNTSIGDWQNFWWWAAGIAFFGFVLTISLIASSNDFPPFPYLRGVYCPKVGDCIPFLRWDWPLPVWYWFKVILAIVAFISGVVTQWEYRRGHWCLTWYSYLIYLFTFLYFFGTLAEPGIFIGLAGSPIPTALVGYGIPVIYTVWFFSAVLPPMRRLWRGERLDFRPSPLKLQAGLGSTVALLGIVGVALGRMFGEMPHGQWGYFVVGVIGTPWLMYLSIHYGVKSLLTLAPWRIVLEAEAQEQEGRERQ